MMDVRLTGRRRFRAHRGRIVLQVEERGMVFTHSDVEWRRRWRDARLEDISIEEAQP